MSIYRSANDRKSSVRKIWGWNVGNFSADGRRSLSVGYRSFLGQWSTYMSVACWSSVDRLMTDVSTHTLVDISFNASLHVQVLQPVFSFKSSVQKRSSLAHRLATLSGFVRKGQSLCNFFLWQCFALAFSRNVFLLTAIATVSVSNVRQGSPSLAPVLLNRKPAVYWGPKNKFTILRKIIPCTSSEK